MLPSRQCGNGSLGAQAAAICAVSSRRVSGEKYSAIVLPRYQRTTNHDANIAKTTMPTIITFSGARAFSTNSWSGISMDEFFRKLDPGADKQLILSQVFNGYAHS